MSSCSTCHTFNSPSINTIVTLCIYNLRKPASHQYFTLIIIILTTLPHINRFCCHHHNGFLHHFPVNSLSAPTSIIQPLLIIWKKINLSCLCLLHFTSPTDITTFTMDSLETPASNRLNSPPGADFSLGYSLSQIFEQLACILRHHLDVLLLGTFFSFPHKIRMQNVRLHYCLDYVTSCSVMTQCNFHCYTHSEPGHVRVGPASRWNSQM
jgi:hypothetical protein